MKEAILKKNKIQIKFQFSGQDNDLFSETLKQVRSLEGRQWISDYKYWTAVLCEENIVKLKEYKFNVSPELLKWVIKDKKPLKKTKIKHIPLNSTMRLYPFQHEGVEFIEAMNGRALLGDEMGLGKTAQAIAWLELHPEIRPVVIVVPASVKYNWQKEVLMWTGKKSKIISGRNGGGKESRSITNDKIIILNYDILKDRLKELFRIKPKAVILDECHYIKNSKTQRTSAVKELCRGVKHVIALSGTPIVSKPIEFYNIIKLLCPTLFPNKWYFANRYCGAQATQWGWDLTGATNTEELNDKLIRKVMIRRKKIDVLKDLPPKIRSVVPIEINNTYEYNQVENDVIKWIRDNEGKEKAEKAKGAEILVQMEKLKQVAVKGKMKQAIKWIEDFLDTGQKLVLFATHIKTLDILEKHFEGRTVRIDGSVSAKKRQEAVMEFQSSQTKMLFLGNIKAAGIGISLTASSNTCTLELGWTPGEHIQAEDRVHRIGQRDSVTAWYLVAKNTIEEQLMKLLEKKSKVLDQVLDGAKPEESSIFGELLKSLKGGKR